ncbi:hypothetical protein BCCH1_76780 (plasmid) [Burkholderia contaminans]|uniref:Uncharacterized protein n=1 Tax=Burkholderia contaminans TaxID=488447 RepID=A0A250LKV9_9BURK|nr:hypothetical protein BCCH1_76780 [Burkholderia contaminans]
MKTAEGPWTEFGIVTLHWLHEMLGQTVGIVALLEAGKPTPQLCWDIIDVTDISR